MPDQDVCCPFCRRPIDVDKLAGFAYSRSKVAAHIETCDCRSLKLDREGQLDLAGDLVAAIFQV